MLLRPSVPVAILLATLLIALVVYAENFSNVPNAPGILQASGTGPDERSACKAAMDNVVALAPRGTYCRHPHCIKCWRN